MAAKTIEADLQGQTQPQIVKNVRVIHGQDKSNQDLHPYLSDNRNQQPEVIENEAMTLVDAIERTQVDGNTFIAAGQQAMDLNNEQEMYHCSVGQSTAFGQDHEFEMSPTSRFDNLPEARGIVI